MNKKILKGLCIILCSVPLTVGAQTSVNITGPDRLYQEGKHLFHTGAYAASIPSLRAFVRENRDSTKKQEADFMLAVANYKLEVPNRISLLEEYIDKYPDTPHRNEISSLIASAYFYEHKYENAIAHYNGVDFDKLAKAEVEDNIYRYAISNLKTGNKEQAKTWFEVLQVRSRKYQIDSSYYLSYIAYTERNYDAALEGFLTLRSDSKYKDLVPYYIASSYYFKGDYRQAADIANSYLATQRRSILSSRLDMYRILAESNFALNQYEKAIKNFNICLDEGYTLNRSAMYKLGLAYYKLGIYNKAIIPFGKASNGVDELAQNAYLHLGLSYVNLSDRNNARMAFQQAAAMDGNAQIREKALYNYALNVHETSFSAFGESVTVFERFLDEYPNSIYKDKVSDYLAELYMNTRSYHAALKSIDRIANPSTRILEAKQKILFQLGVESFANQNYTESIAYFSRSLGLGRYNRETRANAAYWRGESYYRLGKNSEAARNFRDYLSLTPTRRGETYALAFYNLAYISFNNRRFEEAESLFATYTENETGSNRLALGDAFNRRGDCYLQKKAFIQARGNYTRALNVEPLVGDYSLYQLSLVAGLQKKYREKVSLIRRLVNEYPNSAYAPQSQYEEGRAFVQLGQNGEAIHSFKELIKSFPRSFYSRKAAAEIGLLYYQNGKYDEAIAAYKGVLHKYPGSDEARMAMKDLRSLYVDLNRVDEYASLAASVPGGIKLQPTEQDSLTYIAAEKRYMQKQYNEAETSFERYLTTYPNGAFKLNAHYYLSVLNRENKDNDGVMLHTEELLKYPDNPYYEEALVMQTDIVFANKNYNKALDLFKKLAAKTSSPERLEYALIGQLHAAVFIKNVDEVIVASTALLAISKLSPELRNEALYYRGKSYLAQKERDLALKDLKEVSLDTRTLYGAESKYLVAEVYFNNNKLASAEKELLQFIDQSTPHSYWLARGFILLSDVYVAEGRALEARQYLLSLQQNYHADDEIADLISVRLEKLKTDIEQ